MVTLDDANTSHDGNSQTLSGSTAIQTPYANTANPVTKTQYFTKPLS